MISASKNTSQKPFRKDSQADEKDPTRLPAVRGGGSLSIFLFRGKRPGSCVSVIDPSRTSGTSARASQAALRVTAWILCAICAINGAPQPEIQRDIRNFWVEEQREYHRKAGKKTTGQMEKNDRILGTALKISILLYAAALVYEFAFGGLAIRPLLTLNDPENGRTLLKIVLGTLSAGTLFMANYYGKMSLRRVTADHEKMVKFFDKAAEQLDRYGQNEHILEALAREELAENGNWCSFQRDNAPELNL